MNIKNKIEVWENAGTEPDAERKASGFTGGFYPPAGIFNWLFNRHSKAVDETQTFLESSFDDNEALKIEKGGTGANTLEQAKRNLGIDKVPNVATNDQTPTYTEASTLTNLTSGELLSSAFGKIKKAITDLIAHIGNKKNPHGVTKDQVGLGNVDNTSDTSKPVSTAQAKAIADAKSAGTTAQSDINAHSNKKDNPHGVTKEQVGLGNVPNVATNDQTPTYSDTTTLATLQSGEKLNVSFQKIKCAITNLINHLNNKNNPHKVTCEQLGAVSKDDIIQIAKGGTGASTVNGAVSNLLCRNLIGNESIVNANTLIKTGIHKVYLTDENLAVENNYPYVYGNMLVISNMEETSYAYVIQMFLTTNGIVYIRSSTNNGSTWTTWAMLYGTNTTVANATNADTVDGYHVQTTPGNAGLKPIFASTYDLTAGTSDLETGTIYFVYV